MGIVEIEEIIIGLLFIATLVGIVVKRLGMPYTVGLVIVGLALELMRSLSPASAEILNPENIRGLLIPQLILGILVPPLIFEAAFHIKFDDLRRNLWIILGLAVPGVILTMFIVGGVVSWGTGLALPVALVFGALIAATDPVAVVALFGSLGVPKRLQTLLEGESLFNDGTAIVIYTLMLSIVATGEFNLATSVLDFFIVAGGGIVLGLALGSLTSRIILQVNDHLLEAMLTLILAYGSYLIAEELHVSGVLAVVAAGLISGNIGPRGMSPTSRIAIFNFWEYAAFLANSIVFLLLGLVINLRSVLDNWQAILLAIGAVLAARAIVIYTLGRLGKNISIRWQHVLYWGGLRGAISLALALSLPATLGIANVELLQDMAFGVVLFTILGQGGTMSTLLTRLKVTQLHPSQAEYDKRQARAVAAQSAYDHIQEMNRQGMISNHAWEMLEPSMLRSIESMRQAVREIVSSDSSVEVSELNNAYREGLRVQRDAFNSLHLSGSISEEAFSDLSAEIDEALSNEEFSYAELLFPRAKESPPLTRLLTTVIHQDDMQQVSTVLGIMGIPIVSFASAAGAGPADRITLMIAVEESQQAEVIDALARCCEETVDHQPGILDLVLAGQGEQAVSANGKIKVYVFEIEHYEEF
ncbi:MAG: Na+/H+ antiporter [Chloroflexi bacterium]|nr:MAG: Na+/H+ antiporter [Chloroflexota bacterium]MBL1195332.1 Na+/H+ antiporter [Chloroflexota bacterium]NOH12616.1 Na+/H+ antiporter [Chloroflexota bacterium]